MKSEFPKMALKVMLVAVYILGASCTQSQKEQPTQKEQPSWVKKVRELHKQLTENEIKLVYIDNDFQTILTAVRKDVSNFYEVVTIKLIMMHVQHHRVVVKYHNRLLVTLPALEDAKLFAFCTLNIDDLEFIENNKSYFNDQTRLILPILRNKAALHTLDKAKEAVKESYELLAKANGIYKDARDTVKASSLPKELQDNLKENKGPGDQS